MSDDYDYLGELAEALSLPGDPSRREIVDAAKARVVELEETVKRLAVRVHTSPEGYFEDTECLLCGVGSSPRVQSSDFAHKPDCLMITDSPRDSDTRQLVDISGLSQSSKLLVETLLKTKPAPLTRKTFDDG